MRKLVWFAIGFAAGCGLCAYLQTPAWLVYALGVAAMVLLAGGIPWKFLRRPALTVLGCTVSLLWFGIYMQNYLFPAIAADSREAFAMITATDYSYETNYGTAVDGTIVLEERTYQIRLYLNKEDTIRPGDVIAGTFRFRVTTPGGREEATYHQGKGIFLLGYQRNAAVVLRNLRSEVEYYAAEWAEQIRQMLRDSFPEDVYPFVKALLLGNTEDLSYAIDTSFKLSGIRHIVAVSGLHVSILFGFVNGLLGKRRLLSALLGIPVLFLFAAVAGFTPSVIRACIMVSMMLLAGLLRRDYDAPTALAFAAVAMLTVNPLTITSVSFQLSVGCVAGILLFQSPINSWLKKRLPKGKLTDWFSSSVSVSLSSMSLTTPLCAYYFGTVSLISPVTNLLTLWLVNAVFIGIVLTCLVSLLSGAVASLLGSLLAWPIRFILVAAKFLGGLPMAVVYTQSVYIVIWLVFCYGLLAVFVLSRNKRPGLLSCCAAAGLCLALLASWMEPLTDDVRMTVLDVGQGQSILLQSAGRTVLVDCGGDSDTGTADLVAGTLLSQGVSRLDAVILTHGDRDHAGALENLLTRVGTDLLLLPESGQKTYPDAVYVSEDLELAFDGVRITIFGPILPASDNENSLCVLFESENCDILITGDRDGFGERMLLRHAQLPDVDVLIAGHHGSKYSTCEELLQAVQPETVIISAGEDNSYGHPAPELLERLALYSCTVYRTDQNGTIVYRK